MAREKDFIGQVWGFGGQVSGELPEQLAKSRRTNIGVLGAGEGSWLEPVLKAKIGPVTSFWSCWRN